MDRSANDRQRQGSPSEEECLRDAARMGFSGGVYFGGTLAQFAAVRAADGRERLSRLVHTIESEVIPRLVQAHRPSATDGAGAGAGPEAVPDLRAFARLCFGPDEAPMLRVVRDWRAAGCPVERVFAELVGPAARELGLLWEEDACDFTDVTVGVGRLQQLLRELSPAYGAEVEPPVDGRRILLLPAPGEQHTLGLSMVSEFFRHAGWDVVGGIVSSGLDPVETVQAEWFDVLGLSAGHHARVQWLRDCIDSVRRASRNQAIGVLVGGPLFASTETSALSVGADAVITDGLAAPPAAEALLSTRGDRL
jgi:methanogenic corrinoid protein MtbC1